ncbi:LacI family transcriptional regulator [Amycolatopsis taiwanensis]|uniref:LacI family transcriptional regulator n=1 Tax=Amycolatopsis taiwanensis TaxID=342230 RepID=A0A9W6R4B3_9PSEU|nr:LacI family transcriptional regulator [Amycolatopsis taiwanensis]
MAAAAGVSIATVSLVINGKAAGRVSPATQARVEKAIADLGYVVDSAARSLVTGRRQCVALVAPDVGNPFFSQVAAGVATALGTEYRLLLAVSGAEHDQPDLDQLVAFGVDGILLEFPGAEPPSGQIGCPVVLLDEPSGPPELSRVYFDTRAATREMVDQLVELGHRNIVYLDASREGKTFETRRRQVANRLRRTPGTALTRVRSDIKVDDASTLVAESLPDWRRAGVTAIISATDVLGYGALSALGAAGVSVPKQMSLVSFDDLPFSKLTSPALTTVRLSAYDLGYASARILREQLAEESPAPRQESLPAMLINRSSVGPARRLRARG